MVMDCYLKNVIVLETNNHKGIDKMRDHECCVLYTFRFCKRKKGRSQQKGQCISEPSWYWSNAVIPKQ